jgi:hypothetical protein
VGRNPNPFVGTDHTPRRLDAQILLTNVNPAGTRESCDVGAVIDDKRNAWRNQERREPARRFKKLPGRRRLVPVLEQTDAGIGEFLGTLYFGNGKQCCV